MDRVHVAAAGTGADAHSQGDVYWVEPDASKGSIPGHPHPHVIVQDDVFNRSRIGTVVVCALTSNLHRATEPGNVFLDSGEGGLGKRSVVVVSQVSCLYTWRLGARIGTLSRDRVEQILAGMRFQQASFFRGGAREAVEPPSREHVDEPSDREARPPLS
ncbi:MAG TPA: type II toxin-antitoxin system PemK/MazF family toxin [Gemmatimonas sp.]|nr:type II toxin-antitoxin system PemK/MazF family toxin [Gemmatimonas sp.]